MIVHQLDQAEAVLKAAAEAGVEVQLVSAPHAAASAGVGYLHALGEAVGHELLIDCDDDAGLVMAALRAGCRQLLFSGPDLVRERLVQMAKRAGATLIRPEDRSLPCLALAPDDGDHLLRARLQGHAPG